jgi:hypothetical protein
MELSRAVRTERRRLAHPRKAAEGAAAQDPTAMVRLVARAVRVVAAASAAVALRPTVEPVAAAAALARQAVVVVVRAAAVAAVKLLSPDHSELFSERATMTFMTIGMPPYEESPSLEGILRRADDVADGKSRNYADDAVTLARWIRRHREALKRHATELQIIDVQDR